MMIQRQETYRMEYVRVVPTAGMDKVGLAEPSTSSPDSGCPPFIHTYLHTYIDLHMTDMTRVAMMESCFLYDYRSSSVSPITDDHYNFQEVVQVHKSLTSDRTIETRIRDLRTA